MLLLLLTWTFLLILALSINRVIWSDEQPLFTQFVLGVVCLILPLHIWAFFLPANVFLAIILVFFIMSLIFQVFKRRDKLHFPKFDFEDIVLLLFLLWVAARAPYMNDDGAYYQQTIKWLASYGFVPGLANLKIHYGFTSSWHLLSSVFYFDELEFSRYYNFNGLFLWVLLYSLKKQGYSLIPRLGVLILGVLFVNAPSPDLVVAGGTLWLLLTIRIIKPVEAFILIGFLITVKIIALSLILLIPVILYREHTKSILINGGIILAGSIMLLVVRNVVLSGYPLFPIEFQPLNFSHQVPVSILEAFQDSVILEAFDRFQNRVPAGYDVINILTDRFKAFFFVRPYKVALNVLSLLTFFIAPVILLLKRNRPDSFLATFIILTGIVWFFQAPYYRFVLGFILFLPFLVFKNVDMTKYITPKILISIALIISIFLQLQLGSVLTSVKCGSQYNFKSGNVILPVDFPEVPSVKKEQYIVTECAYCFDLPVPCFSEPVTEYYLIEKGFKPELSNPEEIKDGFKMMPVRP